MNLNNKINSLPSGRAICYSGFREGQSPELNIFPSYNQVKEDLLILQKNWQFIRLYNCDLHAETVLEVIKNENLNLKVFLGVYIVAEMNNFGCPWGGGVYEEEELENNKKINQGGVKKLIKLANEYKDIVFALSAGNEACVDWTDHFVPVKSVIQYVREIKENTQQPVTFCDNYVPWLNKLKDLVEEVDFISIHTYPVWEYKHIHEALEYTKENYYAVTHKYPDKKVVITEAGWATNSNGRGINPDVVSEENQKIYYNDFVNWTSEENILAFFFEAFDEPWKGSPEPLEPEKHWGLFTVDRKPKLVMQDKVFSTLKKSI
ncbi:MAG: glycoside hydrolase family 17 protein [Lutibacter sp.]